MKRLAATILGLAVLVFCSVLAIAPSSGRAANFSWSNPAGGNWSATSNWSSDTVTTLGYPSSADQVQ